MDDLMSKFEELILHAISAESRLEEKFKKSTQNLDDHVAQCIATGTPVQNKKRPKRLDSVDHDGPNDREHETSTTSNSSTISQTNHRKNSTHDVSRQQNLSKTQDELESSHTRPARTARIKAAQHLKEPGLNHKMRQPSITVKQERISMEIRKDQVEQMELDAENDANVLNGVAPLEKEKEVEKRRSNDEGFGSNNEKDKEAEEAPSEREMSIMVIPQPIPKVEVLSDEEAAEKMPPPTMPPPKTRTRAKKGDKTKTKNSHVFPLPIKKEKDADDLSSSSAVSSAESSLSSTSVKSSERIRKKKASAQLVDMSKVHIKTEKLSSDCSKKTSKSKTAVEKPSTNTSPAASEKSVYEDALDGDSIMRPLVVALDKVNVGSEPEKNQTFAMEKNGTFSLPASNGTFVVPSPIGGAANGTFQVKSPENGANATFDIRQLPVAGNSTFVMDTKTTEKQQQPPVNSSIMTEDNSLQEEYSPELHIKPEPKSKPSVPKKPSTVAKPNQKKNHALFSMQSPIKTRIEAFEKAAICSPMHTRTGKVTTPSQSIRLPPKTSTTPLASQRFPSSAKASSIQTTPTAQNSLSQMGKGISSSASKLAHLQKKPTLASATLTKSHSLSREPSIDRIGTLSGATSSSSLALLDEKKKNREEKQRLAQQQREQLEKEKREHAERVMREKDEKLRKLVQEKEDKLRAKQVQKAKKMEEFEKRRHLEELNQRQLAEQKREELARLEQLQRAAREQEILKLNQAKENYEIKLHKQMYQQKIQQQQKLQQQHQLELLKQKSIPGALLADPASKPGYFNFDMIATDDSTDDETVGANKKTKRPPLPPWTSKENRLQPMRIQSQIQLKVIDQFFSVAPMTPDLREIFPTIDARKLKRNSSAVWRTPPRYSQMPKY
ncbi:inner centromere protein [Wyeomyia smithii]|uniref:inner centromere protein n=1 Tax=Wyeomyia smithii TaxID=174621 RepID=UPI00246809C0|nr:inner centromere protein [Wyeomyia smithii]